MGSSDLLNILRRDLPIDSIPECALIAIDNGFGVDYSGDQDLIFDMGSVTKIISTTSIILKLIEGNQLHLDDKVSQFLSGVSLNDLSVRDLLSHRTGLWEWRPFYIELADSTELLSYIGDLPLRYPVKSARHYSDLGFILLGAIIEKITHKRMDINFSELIARPLELSNTSYAQPTSLEKCIPSSYGDNAELKMVTENFPYPVNDDPQDFVNWRNYVLRGEVNDGNAFHVMKSVSGHAGLFASPRDVMSYGRDILRSIAGKGYFDPILLNEFLQYEVDEGQALGFQRYKINCKSKTYTAYGHTGFPGIALAVVPEVDLVFGLFTNRLLVMGEPFRTQDVLLNLLQESLSNAL